MNLIGKENIGIAMSNLAVTKYCCKETMEILLVFANFLLSDLSPAYDLLEEVEQDLTGST